MITMFDSIDIAALPAGAPAYAGYVNGAWPTFSTLLRVFPGAHLLDIAVTADADATCLDVEKGDATNADVYGWFTRQQARKAWRPVLYTSASNVDSLAATMTANGFPRTSYRLWSAHYGAGEHICGPAACKLTRYACDGTQWTDNALGRNLDQSVLASDFFGTPRGGNALTPAVCFWQNRRFEFGLAPYGSAPRSVYYRSFTKVAGQWKADQKTWTDIGGAAAAGSGVSASISDEGEVCVVVVGTDGAMWHNLQPPNGTFNPHGWASDGGKFA